MRNTIVYVLHLLVDEDHPDELHGILRNVLTGQEQSFSDPLSLLEVLQAHPMGYPKVMDEAYSSKSAKK